MIFVIIVFLISAFLHHTRGCDLWACLFPLLHGIHTDIYFVITVILFFLFKHSSIILVDVISGNVYFHFFMVYIRKYVSLSLLSLCFLFPHSSIILRDTIYGNFSFPFSMVYMLESVSFSLLSLCFSYQHYLIILRDIISGYVPFPFFVVSILASV